MTVTASCAALALVLAVGPARNARPPAEPAPAAPPAALSEAEISQRIEAYLGSFDTPIPAERWTALGPRAVPLLAATAKDPQQLPSRRARALGALGLLGGSQARQAVLAAARDAAQPFAVRASAFDAAGRLVAPAALVRELRPFLERDPEPAVRAAAASALSRHAGTSGCAAVRAQSDREPPAARGHFLQALERCGG